MNRLALFLAQGFWVGRIPIAPGTFGSVVGLGWTVVLLSLGNVWGCVVGAVLGVAASVWAGGRAEKLLGRKDPGCVVSDEIAAFPFCFLAWAIVHGHAHGDLMAPSDLWTGTGGLWTAGVFVAFRILDIAKPWPTGPSQKLPGGWGITVDDLLAAVQVNLIWLAAWAAL